MVGRSVHGVNARDTNATTGRAKIIFAFPFALRVTGCVTESASGTFQSTGRKPGDILTQGVHRLAPAALTRRTHPAGSVTDRPLHYPRRSDLTIAGAGT